jgi:exo-1,4-beta-D-glucosaminidase
MSIGTHGLLLVALGLGACARSPSSAGGTDLSGVPCGACDLGAPGGSDGGGSDGFVPCTSCPVDPVPLADGWRMQASGSVSDTGAAIATAGYAAAGWYPIRVPTTVLGGLLQNQVHTDLFYSNNLATLDATPFAQPWWYRTEFTLPATYAGHHVWFHLDGINYKATLWLNGQLVAGPDQLVGTFRQLELDITPWLSASGTNALALAITPPDFANDLTLTWVDWNPAPPDHGMGLWRDVYLTRSGPVTLRAATVASTVDLPALDRAHLAIHAALTNAGGAAVDATVSGTIDGTITFAQTLTLAPGEQRQLAFDEGTYSQLAVDHPALWWPRDLGSPERHTLVLTARVQGEISDQQTVRFGIRRVDSEVTPSGGRLFKINGKPILIRGGAWTPDLLLRPNWNETEAHLGYLDDLGLNAVRLEGKLVWDELFDRFDAHGMLVILGWNCCDRWQQWPMWSPAEHTLASASLRDQSLRLGNHPSVIDFLVGSDQAPPPDVEQEFADVLQQTHWPDVVSSSAAVTTTPILGASGFKMLGPYEWVPPSYWELDTARGGAFGFASEISPGPAIPTLESLQQMLSPADLDVLWQQPAATQLHAGQGQFSTLAIFDQALAARMGAPTSLADYVQKAQVMNYEAERAMFEAYGRNKYAQSTGVIQWMLNNAWPSLIWHLFDYYLEPAGAYFGAKKGNERLHIAYSYDDGSIVVVNHGAAAASDLGASVKVYNLDGSVAFATSAAVDVPADGVQKVLTLPALAGLSSTWFVVLALTDSTGRAISDNVYWLSTAAETIDFAHADWYHAPTTSFADFSALAQLPAASLTVAVTGKAAAGPGRSAVTVTLTNGSPGLAFFVRLRLTAGGKEVLPIWWSDNYVSIAPGGARQLTATYALADLQGAAPTIEVSGWNVALQTVTGF